MGKRNHVANLMFTITLLGVFALAALFVAVMGAEVYSNSADKMQANFDTRSSLVYISEKVRQCPSNEYRAEQVEGKDALVLNQTYNDLPYETWIYVHNEKLYEVLVAKDTEVIPGDGQSIMELKSLTVEMLGADLVKLTVVNMDGDENSLTLSRRS